MLCNSNCQGARKGLNALGFHVPTMGTRLTIIIAVQSRACCTGVTYVHTHCARAYACLTHEYTPIYMWGTAFTYGVLHLYMECYINIWSAPYIYGALIYYIQCSIYYIQCSIYIWSTLYSIQCSIYIWSAPFIYGVLHIYMEHSFIIYSAPFITYSAPFIYGALCTYMEGFWQF